jgi:hypothetical protein
MGTVKETHAPTVHPLNSSRPPRAFLNLHDQIEQVFLVLWWTREQRMKC